tara:strand:+ start:237 stop:464 length:228 start_codon:yes stop_codon:yes gene_type:complete
MKNILIELPEPISAKIKMKAHDEVADTHLAVINESHAIQIKTLKDKLYQEKCRHQSNIYFKNQSIKDLERSLNET